MYLRKAADEPVFSTGAVLAVQAVVERAGVADGHIVQTDVQLRLDAAAQVVAAAGELKKIRKDWSHPLWGWGVHIQRIGALNNDNLQY